MVMDTRNHDSLAARSEFYLCLARAFLAPTGDAMLPALRDLLADELGELALPLGYDIEPLLRSYRDEMREVVDAASLLQIYSAIFLAPPVQARINAGMYLDGAMNGGSVKAIEAAYLESGVERDAGFLDLADHVAAQLEFVALLYARQAAVHAGQAGVQAPSVDPGLFLHAHAARWIGPLCADLARSKADRELPANPYYPLAMILFEAVRSDAVAPEVDARALRSQRAIEQARARYAAQGIRAQDMREIRRKLEAQGLATDHLDVAPEGRDAAMGLGKKRLPGKR